MLKRAALLALAGCLMLGAPALAQSPPDAKAVIKTYADIAQASYADSLARAKQLQAAVNTLVATPSEQALKAARTAWIAARVPYQQTEVFRFGNPVVDAWEGRVNAWPLDEGLIDYVDEIYAFSDENPLGSANVIAAREVMLAGRAIDTAKITRELLADTLQEAGGVETNVAIGYHAIEFLLWGQDLNGTRPGAGNRPWTDYSRTACTHENCDRRGDYLRTVTDLLVDDLAEMVAKWGPQGEARLFLVNGDPKAALNAMLTGIGSLAYGELAGERMKLGLLLNDPEEEHDCFSDNTHNSHYNDVVGMLTVYRGDYRRIDGTVVKGPSLSALVKARDAALDAEMNRKLDTSLAAMKKVKDRADAGEAYDQMLAAGNREGNALLQAAIDALADQTRVLERVVARLDVGSVQIMGSDSLDKPDTVAR